MSKLAEKIDNAVLEAASNRGLRGLTKEERIALIDQKLSDILKAVGPFRIGGDWSLASWERENLQAAHEQLKVE